MKATNERKPRSTRAPKRSLRRLYRELFGRPALSVIKRARRAAERYRDHLRERYGPGVPIRKVLAFELVYRVALRFPECWEDIYAAGKAGCEEEEQRKAATRRGVGR